MDSKKRVTMSIENFNALAKIRRSNFRKTNSDLCTIVYDGNELPLTSFNFDSDYKITTPAKIVASKTSPDHKPKSKMSENQSIKPTRERKRGITFNPEVTSWSDEVDATLNDVCLHTCESMDDVDGYLSDILHEGKVDFKNIDLFSLPKNIPIAHCVGNLLTLGAGFAKMLVKLYKFFPRLISIRGKTKVGDIVETNIERQIFHLITKPTDHVPLDNIENIRKVLLHLRSIMIKRNIKSLVMPMIGCGLDKQSREEVKKIIADVFTKQASIPIHIVVCDFTPRYQEPIFMKLGWVDVINGEMMESKKLSDSSKLLVVNRSCNECTTLHASLDVKKYSIVDSELPLTNLIPIPYRLYLGLCSSCYKAIEPTNQPSVVIQKVIDDQVFPILGKVQGTSENIRPFIVSKTHLIFSFSDGVKSRLHSLMKLLPDVNFKGIDISLNNDVIDDLKQTDFELFKFMSLLINIKIVEISTSIKDEVSILQDELQQALELDDDCQLSVGSDSESESEVEIQKDCPDGQVKSKPLLSAPISPTSTHQVNSPNNLASQNSQSLTSSPTIVSEYTNLYTCFTSQGQINLFTDMATSHLTINEKNTYMTGYAGGQFALKLLNQKGTIFLPYIRNNPPKDNEMQAYGVQHIMSDTSFNHEEKQKFIKLYISGLNLYFSEMYVSKTLDRIVNIKLYQDKIVIEKVLQ